MERSIKIMGVATITDNGFRFDSGIPSNEQVLDSERKMHGTIKIGRDASAVFTDSGRVYLAPEVHRVAEGDNYKVRRTSRHYIVQIKVPVVESRVESEYGMKRAMTRAMSDITLDRLEIMGEEMY